MDPPLCLNINIPSGKMSPGFSLKLNDDVCQFEVTFFLKMGKYTGTEKDLTLSYPVQVRVKLQSLNLQRMSFELSILVLVY